MKKRCLFVVGMLLFSLLIGCNNKKTEIPSTVQNDASIEQVKENSKAEVVKFEQLDNVFGFADESGKRLITVLNQNGDVLSKPEKFNIAMGNNGEMIDIKFVKWQESNSTDNLRQTAYNFDNMAGYIYEAITEEFIPNKTYFLSTDAVINKNAIVGLKSTKAIESNNAYYQEVDIETVKKVEGIKNRKVVKSSLISETVDNAKICLFVFERQGDDMLASIAYIKDDKVVFKDYPAQYNEMSTWRVDAGDEPGLFEVLFLANSDEGLLLGLTWAAPESENIFILKEANGVFEETNLNAGRYWAP